MLTDDGDVVQFSVVFAIRFDVEICAVEFGHVRVRRITYVTRGLVTCAAGSRHVRVGMTSLGASHVRRRRLCAKYLCASFTRDHVTT